MRVFYSRYPNLRVAGSIDGKEVTIDFSGGVRWPGNGKGFYATDDESIIAWLQEHPAYGIDFGDSIFLEAGPPPTIYTRQELLDALLDSVVAL